jgi:microcystin-dependent protein
MADAHKNFAYSTVATAPSPATSGTSLVVQTGAGVNFPTAPFNATVWPTGAQPTTSNAEIVRVTAVSTDTVTIVRAQESSSARSIIVGDQFAAGITVKALTDIEPYINPTGTINAYAGRTAPANWLACDGSAVSRTTYATLFGVIAPVVGTFTVTIAAPAVVSLTAHGFITGDAVYLTTTGALPTGLVANTLYYIVRVDANSFNLATSLANAIAGTKITTTGSQSGTHTINACPYGLGDGSTTFNVPDLRGRVAAGADQMFGAAAASRITLNTTQGVYNTLGASGGEQAHQLTTVELASHTHSIGGLATNTGTNTAPSVGNNPPTWTGATGSTGGDTAHNNIQPTLVVNYIIKT